MPPSIAAVPSSTEQSGGTPPLPSTAAAPPLQLDQWIRRAALLPHPRLRIWLDSIPSPPPKRIWLDGIHRFPTTDDGSSERRFFMGNPSVMARFGEHAEQVARSGEQWPDPASWQLDLASNGWIRRAEWCRIDGLSRLVDWLAGLGMLSFFLYLINRSG